MKDEKGIFWFIVSMVLGTIFFALFTFMSFQDFILCEHDEMTYVQTIGEKYV